MDEVDHTQVAIVGGGPIGIELAAALAEAGVPHVVIEAGPIGATIDWWAPGTRFFSSPERIEIAGVPLVTSDQEKATREAYLAYLRAVVGQHRLRLRTYERVTDVRRLADGFELRTAPSPRGVGDPRPAAPPPSGGASLLRAARVVLAIGNMHAPRRLEIPGEDGSNVSHYLRDPHRYAGRRVLIVGGKNSAVEAALRCYRVGAGVAISYRGDAFDRRRVKYWLRPEVEWLIERGAIAWHPRTRPVAIERDRVRLLPVPAADDEGEAGAEPRTVPADDVLLLTGYVQDQTLFDRLDVERRGPERAPVFDAETMETSVPGLHVAGTAIGGSQRRTRIFLENSHVHVDRIVRSITGARPSWPLPRAWAELEV